MYIYHRGEERYRTPNECLTRLEREGEREREKFSASNSRSIIPPSHPENKIKKDNKVDQYLV